MRPRTKGGVILHRKPAQSILPPLTYRGADHRDQHHPSNSEAKLLFKDGEWWLDLCVLSICPSPPVAFQDGERYVGATVYPDGCMFEWNGQAFEVMGHDRSGARLWVREVDGRLDLPTTDEPDPQLRRTA